MTERIDITVAVAREKEQPFTIEQATIRHPRADEILVKVVATGLCHTDLIVRDQYYPVPLPAVLGHEGAGVVEEVGPLVTGLQPGDRVALSFGYCGTCRQCRAGAPGYCSSFFGRNFGGGDVDGSSALLDSDGNRLNDHFFAQSSFATHAIALESNAVKISDDIDLALTGPLGCGIQTGAGAVINSLRVRAGDSFASFGAGAVGLSSVMAAKVAGATTIVAVDIVPSRLELAVELGATHVVNSRETDVVEAVRDITGGGVRHALESTGRPEVLMAGIEALGPLGTMGIVGAPPLGTPAQFDVNTLLLGGQGIRGIVEGDSVPGEFVPALVELYRQGRFPFDKLVTFYDLADINQADADASSGATLKAILRMPS